MLRTKVVCTLGPASSEPSTVLEMVRSGMNLARVNMSHGARSDHLASIRAVRAAADEVGRPVSILADLAGPKIRVGEVQEGGIAVGTGDDVIFQRDPIVATADRRPVRFASRYEHLVDDVRADQRLLINDGAEIGRAHV